MLLDIRPFFSSLEFVVGGMCFRTLNEALNSLDLGAFEQRLTLQAAWWHRVVFVHALLCNI